MFRKTRIAACLLACTMLFSGCTAGSTNSQSASSSQEEEGRFTPGTYTGTAEGRNGEIKVEVTLSKDAIESINILEHQETSGVSDPAINTLPELIVKTQSLGVDTIAGCTISSEGIINAVIDALTKAGADIDALKAVEIESGEAAANIEETYDVIIVGAGGAGMAAALAAAQEGASVAILEKMPNIGGNTTLGEGTYNVADTALLEKTGAKTTPDLQKQIEEAISAKTDDPVYQALMDKVAEEYKEWKDSGTDTLFDSASWHALQTYLGGGEIGDLPLIEAYADQAVEGFKWLTEDVGVPFKDSYIFMAIGGKWQRGHQIDMVKATGKEGDNGGSVYIRFLKEKAEKLGAVIYTDANVTEITTENNAVTGAVAERSDGSTITLHANKGVVLTTGGFAANSDLVYKYSNGTITTKLTSCAKSSTGDGIALAEKAGAATVDLDQIQVHPLGDPQDGCVAEFVGNWLSAQHYMFVNKEGERFVKEDGTRYEMSMAELQQTDGQMWLIVDSSQIAGDDSRSEQIKSLIADGHTFVGETLEELAQQINIDPEVLKATVETYNTGMTTGNDAFGKATSPDSIISVGPFYASLRTPTVHHTMGGVKINSNAEVLDADGNVIKGFYAAGEVTGGIHGNNRLGGNAYPDIIGFGRVAGMNAAK